MEQRSEETHSIVRADRVRITAVVATYNEEAHIGTCLQNLLNQRGVEGAVEILVVDGRSTDMTVRIVRSFAEFGDRVRSIENPRRLQVYAWNAALREARGEYFAMIGAHAEYGPTYLAKCLEVMERTGAAGVGGIAAAYGEGYMGEVIAWCMSSPFGIGNARFRYTDREEETDSVFALFTRTQTLLDVGGFDESLPFDEDSDLNYRLRQRGGKIVVSPDIKVRYAVRRSLRALRNQMFRYGYWRRFTQLKHRGAVPLRVFAPAALVGGVALSLVFAAARIWPAALAVPVLYGAFVACATAAGLRRLGVRALCVPAALTTMHFAYGVGYWRALLDTMLLPLRRRARTL